MSSIFNASSAAGADLSTCVEVRLNMSSKKVKSKDVKPSGWRHVSNVASGPVAFHEDSGEVLLTFSLFTEGGETPIPAWGFKPQVKIKTSHPELKSFSDEELLEAGVAEIEGWEKVPLTWEGLEQLQRGLTGAPGLRASFTVKVKEAKVVQLLIHKEWSNVSLVLTLDLSSARAGKVSGFKDRFSRSIEARVVSAEVADTVPTGEPVKNLKGLLQEVLKVSSEPDNGEEESLFAEANYLKCFGGVGETSQKSKAWKRHASMLGSQNSEVKALAVFCLGQLLSRGALKPGNADQLMEEYGVEITPVEGRPSATPEESKETVQETVSFDGIDL